jgi:hypothetical protein
MRLIKLLMILACVHAQQMVFAQTVSLSLKNAPIEEVFTLIEKQTGVRFFYRVEILKNTNKVTIRVINASLQDVLMLCFKNQPITYVIIDNTIVVKLKRGSSSLGKTDGP